MELNGYEKSQINVGVPLIVMGIVTVLIFDSLLPFLFVCLAVDLWLIAYMTEEAFDDGERTREPKWYGGNEGGSEVSIEYSRYNDDWKPVDVLVDSRKVVRIYRGNKVTVRCDPSSEIRIQPEVYEGFVLPPGEPRTACYLYRWGSYGHADDGTAVESCLRQ